MTDIVERLRNDYSILKQDYDALRADNERLRAALEERIADVMPASAQLLNITKGCLDNAEAENERLRKIIGYLEDHADIPISVRQDARRHALEPKP